MRPISLDTTYDALTIVIDQCENELEAQDSFFKRELNAVFESKKLIYYKDNQMSADEFFKDVARKVKSHEAMLPASKRMVICNYLDAYKLSHDWLQGYRERMDKFRSMVAIRTGFDQYYITFVRYQADNPIGEVRDEVYEVLQQLWNIEEQLPMEHAEFLLYAGGFDSLETHEKGMVRFLQLLGMKDYWKVYDYASFEKALYLLAYEDYYEKRAQICQSEIQKINDWMNQAKDPDMLNFEMISREALTSMLQRYTDEMVKFKRLSGLYPVSITEYTSHGFGPFRTYTRSSQKHAELDKEKERYQKSYMDMLESSKEKEELLQKLSSNINYPDFQTYVAEIGNGRLEDRIRATLDNNFDKVTPEDKRLFGDTLFRWIKEFIMNKVEELEKEKKRKEDKKSQMDFEMQRANHFETLKACFNTIKDTVEFQAITEIVPTIVGEIALVNGEIGSNWITEGYHIEGIPDERVAVLPEISPYEIQYLKFGRYIELNQGEATKRQLSKILK